MRPGLNSKRPRNHRANMRRGPAHGRSQNFDSNGPDGKVRGSASQVFEKYQALARDASLSGDRIMAENYLQHAEHYFRIQNPEVLGQQPQPQPQMPQQGANGSGDSNLGEVKEPDAGGDPTNGAGEAQG